MIRDFDLQGTIALDLAGVPHDRSLRGKLILCWRILRGKAVLPSVGITHCCITAPKDRAGICLSQRKVR